jgi:hypothetical protein
MDERMKRSTYVWFEDTMGCGGSILVLRDGVQDGNGYVPNG